MKNTKIILLGASLLVMIISWLLIAYDDALNFLDTKKLLILLILLIAGIISLIGYFRRSKENQAGIPEDDELSQLIKYKTGYLAFMTSMYMWLFLFIIKSQIPDFDTLLAGGILLSAVIWYISNYMVKKEFSEK